LFSNYNTIVKILTKKQKFTFAFLLILVLIGLIFELFSVGIFIPIIQKLSNTVNNQNSFLSNILNDSIDLKKFLYFALFIYILKTFFLIFLIHFQHKFVYGLQHYISTKILFNYLSLNLSNIKENNSSKIINTVISESSTFSIIIINHILFIITEIIICLGLISFLFYYNVIAASIITISFTFFGAVFILTTNKLNTRLGKERIELERKRLKILNEIFQFIKEILINSKQDYFIHKYKDISIRHKNIIQLNSTLIQMPRIFIDLIIFLSFSIMIIYIIDDKNQISNILPTLSIFAIAAMRIMPSFNRVISNIQSVKFNIKVVDQIYNYLNVPAQNNNEFDEPINFNESIIFNNVSFSYGKDDDNILENINITIDKGSIIAITGESGSGKSTIVDLICGLILPKGGSILVDNLDVNLNNKSWKNKIGYVTQDYYISDGPLINNVAFGIEKIYINEKHAIKSLNDSKFPLNLFQPIENFKLSEHGKNISGGQRQRIAIARALYKNADILIFDEATSALDLETEKVFFKDLMSLKESKTIIIITHNEKLLNFCDKVYKIKNKKISNL
jgi:ABC-type multidrug transport system fused ATPase/permease subunit